MNAISSESCPPASTRRNSSRPSGPSPPSRKNVLPCPLLFATQLNHGTGRWSIGVAPAMNGSSGPCPSSRTRIGSRTKQERMIASKPTRPANANRSRRKRRHTPPQVGPANAPPCEPADRASLTDSSFLALRLGPEVDQRPEACVEHGEQDVEAPWRCLRRLPGKAAVTSNADEPHRTARMREVPTHDDIECDRDISGTTNE